MNAIESIQQYENYIGLVKNLAVNTVRGYISDLELLQEFFKIEDWATFTEDMALDYLRELKTTGRDTSVARKIYCFRGFFKFLRKKGVTTADPWGDIELHAIRRKPPQTLSVNEMNKLLTSIRQAPAVAGIPSEEAFLTVRDRALLEVLYSAALRVSELCGANWQDINWTKREITVTGKGNKTRVCPLGQKALDALMEYAPHYERKWERKPEGLAPMFLSMWNRRIETRSIPRTIDKWCSLANVKRVNPHAFRHSAATHMLENGADLRVIQTLLGHASIITTEIYTQVATKRIRTVHANTHPRA